MRNKGIQDPLKRYTNIGIPYLVEQSEDHTLQSLFTTEP